MSVPVVYRSLPGAEALSRKLDMLACTLVLVRKLNMRANVAMLRRRSTQATGSPASVINSHR